MFLYVNPCIVTEVTHIMPKPIKDYIRNHPSETITEEVGNIAISEGIMAIKDLIANEILLVLDGNKDVVLKQIELYKELGSTDAANVALANEYGISFVTVDSKLVKKMDSNKEQLTKLQNVYFTDPKHQTL